MERDAHAHPLPTSPAERRMISAAGSGDAHAQKLLLERYEPMVRHIARRYIVAGVEPEDLAQEARLAIVDAAARWDQSRRVPFSSFAWMCATRQARNVVQAALAQKHRVLTTATSIDNAYGELGEGKGRGLQVASVAPVLRSDRRFTQAGGVAGPPDYDPLAKLLAREQLRRIVDRGHGLSPLERRVLAMAAADHSHREIADTLRIRVRTVNNALQRARAKLREPVAA